MSAKRPKSLVSNITFGSVVLWLDKNQFFLLLVKQVFILIKLMFMSTNYILTLVQWELTPIQLLNGKATIRLKLFMILNIPINMHGAHRPNSLNKIIWKLLVNLFFKWQQMQIRLFKCRIPLLHLWLYHYS